MTRTCTICTHEQRQEIDKALVAGTSFRNIAERFGTSVAALYRHKQEHLPAAIAKAHEAKEVVQANSLLDRLMALSSETAEILREARGSKDHDLALRAIARAEKQIELQAKLLGELKSDVTVNVQTGVSVSSGGGDDGDGVDWSGKVLDILAKAKAIVLPGQTEDQGDPGPSGQGQSADEAHLLPTGTVTETVTPVTVTQGTQGKTDEARSEEVRSLATPETLEALRAGALKIGASIRWVPFTTPDLRRIDGESAWRQYIADAVARGDERALRFIFENFGAALPSEVAVTITGNAVTDEGALIDRIISIGRQLGFPGLLTRKGNIPAGEAEWRKFLAGCSSQTLQHILETVKAQLSASSPSGNIDVDRMLAIGKGCGFPRLELRDGRVVPEGKAGWRQFLAGADQRTLRLMIEALGRG